MVTIFFIILSTILTITCIFLRLKTKALHRELEYISHRIDLISEKPEGMVLIPTEDDGVKKVAASVNRLLNIYYKTQAQHIKDINTMHQVMTNISHDLRTPLTVLSGYTQILLLRAQQLELKEEVIERLRKVDSKAEKLLVSIKEIFEMAKLESGDLIYHMETVDITALCRDIILEYYDILETRGFRVELNLLEEPAFAEVDEGFMKRILKNLIDNGINHGGDGKYLGLSIVRNKDEIEISIEDHGKGIDKKHMDKIFKRDFTTGKPGESSGLGLAISKEMLEEMEGRIRVESQPGALTVFTIILKEKKLEIS